MHNWRRALAAGLVIWLVPFALSMVVFPLRLGQRALFESLMAVALAAGVVGAALWYFRGQAPTARAGLWLGLIALAVNLAVDVPLFLTVFAMPLGEYAVDIGLTYLLIPVVTYGMGRLAEGRPA